ncbi:ATP-binding protein [Floridanema evergladense]|uniref:histidine kinase n=1 Tax=Floridaenema evergladense BLCC-F167 TaxID=3153639 RepID=A0ABV4WJ09_9CYAN
MTDPQARASAETTASSSVIEAVDLDSLMKAAQALSSEIVLSKLLVKVITVLIENSGAEKGCLILETNGQLQLKAEGTLDPGIASVIPGILVDSEAGKERVALAIVNYVVRTKKSIVLNNAARESQFNRDSYFLKHQPKSILCTPLIDREKFLGILYLENNSTTNAFPEARRKTLQFLLTQAAISINNAQLYHRLEQRMEQRTIELTQTNDRLQAEIVERQLSEQALKLIVEGTSSVTGEDFFRSLVHSLAQALNVRYAFISGCVDPSNKRVRTFAFWHGNNFGENFEYDLSGTPCEQVFNSKGCVFYPEKIQLLFPDEEGLVDWQAESYLGIALLDSSDEILGHLAVLDDKPMKNKLRNQMTLEIFAVRASTEMERRQAEVALQMSEEKFSKAFRSSPDAIILSTLNDGRFIEVNESCLRMFGYSQEEMIGNTALDLGIWARAEDRDRVVHILQEKGSCSQAEFLFRRKSKEVFPGLYAAEMFYLETEPYLLSVVTDITALKQAEKALERLAEIGELAAMIVHEVRNPFTTILMALNSFKRLQLDERFQEYLSLALDESDRLQRLLNQILLYARPQTLQRSNLELNNLISEVLTSLQNLSVASEKRVIFLPIIQPIQVSADKDKLKQVLINLVMNAYEAINEGETIIIQVQEIENDRVFIKIHNGGSPISEDILPQLTKPFFTTKPNGNGLGLAIVKRIIEAHGGNLQIESSAITGTLVKVDLPLVRFL